MLMLVGRIYGAPKLPVKSDCLLFLWELLTPKSTNTKNSNSTYFMEWSRGWFELISL